MPTRATDPDASDLDLLVRAVGPLASALTSPDAFLEAVGLGDMPPAQRYGILFGCAVFFVTLASVVALLFMGGTFRRMAEQARDGMGGGPVTSAVKAREGRPLLLERLLEARERMAGKYADGTAGAGAGAPTAKEGSGNLTTTTRLTDMLLNEAVEVGGAAAAVPDLIEEGTRGPRRSGISKLVLGGAASGVEERRREATPEEKKRRANLRECIPDGYEENYVLAYKKCQERPGGATLSGLPDARFEAYARAYAGCGTRTSPAYRRSYARLYESRACRTHASEKEFRERFESRPRDVIGRTVRLEALEADRHAEDLHASTSGDAFLEEKPYDPREVWGFLDRGPFRTAEEMTKSPVFQRKRDEAAFAVVSAAEDAVIGVVVLTGDDPRNLSIHLDAPIVHPAKDGSQEQLEACFLLLDRLFALGYRRVQLNVDSHDECRKKLPGRLGFTQEGTIPKHLIVRESNRDSNVYGMVNSDWDKGGARAALYKKLHGLKALRADELNNKKEAEYDEWQLALEKQKEAAKAAEETGQAGMEKKK